MYKKNILMCTPKQDQIVHFAVTEIKWTEEEQTEAGSSALSYFTFSHQYTNCWAPVFFFFFRFLFYR